MKGIYHIHSEFSYDAVNSVRDIYDWAKGQGLDFVMITEHDNDFDQDKFERFVAECDAVDDDDVRLIPGIEYSFYKEKKWIHVGVLGVPFFIKNDTKFDNLSSFLDKVKAEGGMSVLNHPIDYFYLIPDELLGKFDFIELWNTKYDHFYAPNLKNLRMRSHPAFNNWFIASSDIHAVPHARFVTVELEGSDDSFGSDAAIINAMKKGLFSCSFEDWKVSSKGLLQTRHARQKILPLLSYCHNTIYKLLRWVVRKLHYKPPPALVRFLKFK